MPLFVHINVCLCSVPINMYLHYLGKIPLHDDDLHIYLFKSSNYSLVHLSHVSWFHESVWSLRDSLIHIGHVTATANTRNRKLIWSEDYTQSSTAQFKWKYFSCSNNIQHWDLDSHSFESWVRIIRNTLLKFKNLTKRSKSVFDQLSSGLTWDLGLGPPHC